MSDPSTWFRTRLVVYPDGRQELEEITEAEYLEDQRRIREYRYFSAKPSLSTFTVEGLRWLHFTWWRLKLAYEPWRGKRTWVVMWADDTKPPIYHTLLSLRQSASHEPITIGR